MVASLRGLVLLTALQCIVASNSSNTTDSTNIANSTNTTDSTNTTVKANTCTCTDGVAKTGAACTTNGTAMCASCNSGFTINTAADACTATATTNTCTCTDGVAKTGAACTTNGTAMCASCNSGFTINTVADACTATATHTVIGSMTFTNMTVAQAIELKGGVQQWLVSLNNKNISMLPGVTEAQITITVAATVRRLRRLAAGVKITYAITTTEAMADKIKSTMAGMTDAQLKGSFQIYVDSNMPQLSSVVKSATLTAEAPVIAVASNTNKTSTNATTSTNGSNPSKGTMEGTLNSNSINLRTEFALVSIAIFSIAASL